MNKTVYEIISAIAKGLNKDTSEIKDAMSEGFEKSPIEKNRIPDGVDGVRDVDSVCTEYLYGAPNGDCQSDGHYLCEECENKVKESTEEID